MSNVIGRIYLIINNINGKYYIGQTTQSIHNRWMGHIYDAKRGNNRPICNAIRKYGADNFYVIKLTEAYSIDQLNNLESFFIQKMNTLKPYGYNMGFGGDNFTGHPETRKKISESKKGLTPWNKGIQCSDETKSKISEATKGKKLGIKRPKRTKEWCEKISASLKGRPSSNKGKPMSDKTKARLSASMIGHKGHPHTEEFKKKLSESLIGNKWSAGKPKSSETRAKMSASAKQRHRKDNGQFDGGDDE